MNRLLIGSSDKTNLLLQLLAQDYPAGVTVIDPTGYLAPAAANVLPARFTQRALYLDPSDMARPVGLNILENVLPDDRQRLTEDICAYFEAMWPNGWGAQSNYILANCLRILLDTPGSTILGVLKLLTDNSYRRDKLTNCDDPVVMKNWEVISGWDTKQLQAAIAPLQNKIGTLLMSPMIRNIVGQSRTTFGHANIIIANLDRSKLGDLTARLMASLLVSRSSGQVYITDLGFLASDHLASIFAQERFTVALQFLDQLPRKLAQATLSIEEKYVFRINPDDAKRLAFYVGLMNPRVLTELASDEARTQIGTIAPEPPPSLPRLKALRKRTHACHTRPRTQVETAVKKFFTSALGSQ